jgi:signal transduction histidine kinase
MNDDAALVAGPSAAMDRARVDGAFGHVIAAWRGLTWKHWVWTPIIALLFVIPNTTSIRSNFGAFTEGKGWYLITPATIHLVAGYCFLLAVTAAEASALRARRPWLPYLAAVLAAATLTAVLVVPVRLLFDISMFHLVKWSDVGANGVANRIVGAFANWLLTGGLLVFVYVRLQSERRARAAFAKAELERSVASRQLLATRLATMQAQVEPRFLFNTLKHVEDLYESDEEAAERMLDHLIDYLRTALPQLRGDASTVGREMHLADAYLNILKMRMGSRLQVAFDVAPDVADMPLAPMLLLPLIDNAVRHGLEPLPLGGRIDLRARVERGRLSLAVADTGIGDPEALAEGAGLASLRERLVGLHGNAAQLTISRTNPHGMTIAIEVPHEATRADC